MNHQRTCDITVEPCRDCALAVCTDRPGQPHVAGDIAQSHTGCTRADHRNGTVLRKCAGQRPAEMDARRCIAFNRDRAAIADRPRIRSAGADARPAGANREWTIEIAILVIVGRQIGFVDDNLAAVDDRTAAVCDCPDSGRAIGVRDLDRTFVGDLVETVDRYSRAARQHD